MDHIYLDFNSTTPIDPSVADAIRETYLSVFANPASQHRPGQRARHVLEAKRTSIARGLGARIGGRGADRLILTSGGTEANNLALRGLVGPDRSKQLLISDIEHPSIQGAARHLESLGYPVRRIPVDGQGLCRVDIACQWLKEPTSLLSVMLANNETGVIQPLAELVLAARERGVLVHTDAVQAIGKMPVDFAGLGVDAMSFAAHKFHGPRGIGGLLLRADVTPSPILFGGAQQYGLRPGTEDVALAAGCARAIELCLTELSSRRQHMFELRDRMLRGLEASIGGAVIVNGALVERLPNTLSLSFPGVNRQELLLAADFAGIAFSTGSTCASGSSEPSSVLSAMGLSREAVEGAIRLSLGATTTVAEVDLAIARISRIVNELRGGNPFNYEKSAARERF